ncbi:GTPase [Nanoarchaeota archaeon]
MAFSDIPQVNDAQFYLDVAFSKASKAASKARAIRADREEKTKRAEQSRIDTVKDVLNDRLFSVVTEYPSLDGLTPFYRELVQLTFNYDEMKMALASVNRVAINVKKLAKEYQEKLGRTKDVDHMMNLRKAFYGRISSMLKSINEKLKLLETARRKMLDFPIIKELPTVCITGFPNVGKSTLLKKLTTADPDIKPYAFTTKRLNLGYAKNYHVDVQYIDTPGTLARDKMNNIERQAYLAMRHAANILIFVWDLTEPYPMEQQKQLFKEVKTFGKPILQYISKSDILEKKKISSFTKRKKGIYSNPEELRLAINEFIESNFE